MLQNFNLEGLVRGITFIVTGGGGMTKCTAVRPLRGACWS